MHVMAARVALVALAIGNGATGLLARLNPHTFYDDFPFGRGWVQADGPYNEHLVTDFGAALLAITALCLVGVWRPTRDLVIGAAVANIVLGGFHIAYHAGVTDLLSTTDNVLSFISIGLGIVLGLMLLPLSRGLPAASPAKV
ncbi:hypothetical protein [Aeromicrobium sp.]|uniref:hypothetical protein n=1 Tax=Aeromicrobium sp. TaxID=1871063 RepID=UPI003C313DC0